MSSWASMSSTPSSKHFSTSYNIAIRRSSIGITTPSMSIPPAPRTKQASSCVAIWNATATHSRPNTSTTSANPSSSPSLPLPARMLRHVTFRNGSLSTSHRREITRPLFYATNSSCNLSSMPSRQTAPHSTSPWVSRLPTRLSIVSSWRSPRCRPKATTPPYSVFASLPCAV